MPKQARARYEDTKRTRDTGLKVAAVFGGWWRELTCLALLAAAWGYLASVVGDVLSSVVLGVVLAAALGWAPARQAILGEAWKARQRRRWARSMVRTGLANPPARASREHRSVTGPRATKVRRVPVGEELIVKAPPGHSMEPVVKKLGRVTADLKAREVRVMPDSSGNARKARVLVVRTDPFATEESLPWPWLDKDRVSSEEPIPLGITELGEPFSVRIIDRHTLIGGNTGAGKSVGFRLFAAGFALDPDRELWTFDGKAVGFGPWEACARHTVGMSQVDAAIKMKELVRIVDERYALLKSEGTDMLTPEMIAAGHKRIGVLIDELNFFLEERDEKTSKNAVREFTSRWTDVLERGRAAGITVACASQIPYAEIVPSRARNLFWYAIAFASRSPQASDTILGQGMAAQGFNAQTIRTPGVAWVATERDIERVRFFHLTGDQAKQIASRATGHRLDADLATLTEAST